MATSLTGNRGLGPSGVSSLGKNTGYNVATLPNFTPEQTELFKSMFSQVGPNSQLSKLAGGDQSAFEQLEAPAHRDFQGQLGQIASRFSGGGGGQGALSGRRSSGFNLATSQAASDFSQDLQARRLGIQRQAMQDLHGMSNDLLQQRPYDTKLLPKKTSFLENLLIALSGGIGQGAGSLGSGYLGAKLGGY